MAMGKAMGRGAPARGWHRGPRVGWGGSRLRRVIGLVGLVRQSPGSFWLGKEPGDDELLQIQSSARGAAGVSGGAQVAHLRVRGGDFRGAASGSGDEGRGEHLLEYQVWVGEVGNAYK